MKKSIIFILLCFWGLCSSAQNLVDQFCDRYGNDGKFTVVNVSSKMFSLIADMSDPETETIIKDLTGFKLLKTQHDIPRYYREVLAVINDSRKGYEELMRVQEQREDVRIYVREVKGVITELIVLVNNSREFVLMGFTGKIDLKKISRLSKSVNVSGMEYLNNVVNNPKIEKQ